MNDVAVERVEIAVAFHRAEQVGAHPHQLAGRPRRAVEPAKQLLPPRLGSEMQVAGVIVRRFCAPGLDRLCQPCAVGTVVPRQRLKEGEPRAGVEFVIAVEHFARHRDAGRLAAARQQRLAQLDQFGGILLAVGVAAPAQQRAPALGNRGQEVGEKGVGHVSFRIRKVGSMLHRFMAAAATIKHNH